MVSLDLMILLLGMMTIITFNPTTNPLLEYLKQRIMNNSIKINNCKKIIATQAQILKRDPHLIESAIRSIKI